jgi:hypothetical protein
MKTILELNRPVKTRKPREVTIAELRTEIKQLKARNRGVCKEMVQLSIELDAERAHCREMLDIMRRVAFPRPAPMRRCTCTPTRADFLRAITRDA